MKIIISLLFGAFLLLSVQTTTAGEKRIFTGSFIDTSNRNVMDAVDFLQSYYSGFLKHDTINYRKFFTQEQCDKYKIPDPIALEFTSYGGYGYTAFSKATIFFAKEYPDYVHIKTIFLWEVDSGNMNPFAIANHYVHKNNKGFYFLTEMEQHKDNYTTVKNGNIQYVFPKSVSFSKQSSDSLLASLRKFEKEWGFKPVEHIRYVHTSSKEELARMKGLDYLLLMDENTSSGYADTESNTVYCQGKGENYLHEILHLYLNPLYAKSPVNHGLVYYLGGGVSGNYPQMIQRMNDYLTSYPDTDLSRYDTLISKNRLLYIDHTINAMLCKLVYEKEGVKGIKRLLGYKTLDELFLKEYKLPRAKWDVFLRKKLSKERSAD